MSACALNSTIGIYIIMFTSEDGEKDKVGRCLPSHALATGLQGSWLSSMQLHSQLMKMTIMS